MKFLILLASVVIFFPFPSCTKVSGSQNSSKYENNLKLIGSSSAANDTSDICKIEREEEFLSPQEMKTLANKITVKVTGNNNGGSGTILGKEGNSYLVITNSHVVRGVSEISLTTFDGKEYPAKIVPQSKFKKSDLALLEFQANQDYCLPSIAEGITGITGLEVIAAGYSADKGEIVFRSGEVKQVSEQALKEGYQIGYSSDIDQGMSGGAIISSDGTLVGINGKSSYPILNTGYVYENGKKLTDAEIQEMRKLSWGIPVRTFLARVDQGTFNAYSLPSPESIANVATTPPLKGWLGEIEQKAKQFTVRIDSSSGANGSGIIIAREGNTYTVLTAAHVLCESENGVSQCPENSYKVMTHDGKKYRVEESTIERKEGVDLGILKFTVENKNATEKSYTVATLADYNPNKDDYVFTVGYPKLGNHSPWRFSPGRIFDKEIGLLHTRSSQFQGDSTQNDSNSDGKLRTTSSTASQSVSSLTGGYELVYTSITYGGMSGGAVLDSQGRVIGIHGRAEGEEAIDETTKDCGVNFGCKVQIGYSLGIPVSTFLGQKFKGIQVQEVEKTVEKKPVQEITPQQKESIDKAVLSADVPQGNAKASQWLERGNQLWRLRRYTEAVKAFDTAIKQQPKSTFIHLAYYGKGRVLFGDGKYQKSITAFEKVVKFQPSFVDAWKHLSPIYRGLEQPEKALAAIDRAIKLQPQNPNLYNEKRAVLERLKRYAEAEAAISKAIKITRRAAFYYNRGLLYSEQKKWNLALSDYNKAIRTNSNFAQAYHNRGTLYKEQKKWELALSDYNKTIQINPNDAKAYYNRGSIYSEQKKWELALSDYNKTIQINPNDADAYNNRGILYYEQKKWELALSDYNKVIQINPNDADAYNNRGILYEDWEKWDLALSDYNKAIQINLNYADAYYNRGLLYVKHGKWNLALSDFSKVIQINPNNAVAYYNRGNIYSNQEKWELALSDYNKAIQINPNDATAYYNRGNLYSEQKKWNLALSDYNKAIQINPNYAKAYAGRGIVYLEKSNKQKAIQDFQQAAQLFQAQGNTRGYEIAMNFLRELQ